MREFLIRTSADHGWPAFHPDRMAGVLQPAGWECEPVGGAGDFRVRAEGVQVSYSGEVVGWHVSFHREMPRAEEWVEQVTRQIATAADEPCEWLELS